VYEICKNVSEKRSGYQAILQLVVPHFPVLNLMLKEYIQKQPGFKKKCAALFEMDSVKRAVNSKGVAKKWL